MSYFDPASWNYAENNTLSFAGDTLTPELPTGTGYDLSPTIAVSTGDANPSGSIAGFLDFGKATAQTLLNAWGTVQGFQNTKAEMELARQIAVGDVAVRSAQATSAQEVAKLTAETQASVERARAAAQVAVAQQKADAARSGTVYVPGANTLTLPVILALGVAAWVAFSRGGKK